MDATESVRLQLPVAARLERLENATETRQMQGYQKGGRQLGC